MSRTMDGLKTALGANLRAAGNGLSLAVAVTDTELVTASSKFFGGPTLTRYPLNELTALEHVPNPTANRLQVHLGTRSVMILYGPEAAAEFSPIVALLKQRLPAA